MRKLTRRIGLFCLVTLFLSLMLPINLTVVHATSSIGSNSGIYSDEQADSPQEPNEKEEAGWVESIFSGMIGGLGDGIQSWLSSEHADLDSIIFGRVGYVKINYFSFDMNVGNPYGILGSWFYGIIRSILLPVLVFVVLYYFLAAAWDTSGKGRAKFKSNLQRYALVIFLLFAAPMIMDVIVYLKDLILFLVQKGIKLSSSLFSGDVGIVASYKENLDKYGNIFDAILYVAAVCISLLFAFSYIATALSTMLLYAFFPIVAAMSFTDSKLIGTWLKTVIGNITIPIIDSLLLYIPVVASTIGAPEIVVFGMTMMLLPSRGVIRQICGLGRGGAAEMLGMGALLAAGRLMSSTAKRGKNLVGNVKGKHDANKSDKNNEKMYKELSESGTTDEGSGNSSTFGGMNPEMDEKRASIMRKFANVDNFENKDFASILSDKEKAGFYAQRRKQTRKSMRSDIAGAVGGTLGMGMGYAAGAFYNPAVTMTAMDMMGGVGMGIGKGAYNASASLGTWYGGKLDNVNRAYLADLDSSQNPISNSNIGGNVQLATNDTTQSTADSQVSIAHGGSHTHTDNVSLNSTNTGTQNVQTNVTEVENGGSERVNNQLHIQSILQGEEISQICNTMQSDSFKNQINTMIKQRKNINTNMSQAQVRANVYQTAVGSEIKRIAKEKNREISENDLIKAQREIYNICLNFEQQGERISKT